MIQFRYFFFVYVCESVYVYIEVGGGGRGGAWLGAWAFDIFYYFNHFFLFSYKQIKRNEGAEEIFYFVFLKGKRVKKNKNENEMKERLNLKNIK